MPCAPNPGGAGAQGWRKGGGVMDNAVALVQAYLHINGYLTVVEYPIVEAMRGGDFRTATDIDVLAFRFAGAGRCLRADRWRAAGQDRFEPDPELGVSSDQADMIIGEVKEGRAELNKGTRDPFVLRSALVRFGCCAGEEVEEAVKRLLSRGSAVTPGGHAVRMVVFASTRGTPRGAARVISLAHVVRYLEAYVHEHWDVLKHVQLKDPAFGFLATREKAVRGAGDANAEPRRDARAVSRRPQGREEKRP